MGRQTRFLKRWGVPGLILLCAWPALWAGVTASRAGQPAQDQRPAGDAAPNGKQPLDAAAKQRVRRLIEQLDANKRAQREEAQKALQEFGPEILPLLPEMNEGQGVELRRRLLEVRRVLQQKKAALIGKPSLVTIRGKGLDLEDVLKELSEQTGNTVIDYREQVGQEQEQRKLDLDLLKAPFWEAIDAVLEQSELGLFLDTEQGELGLVQRGRSQQSDFTYDAGPVRLVPKEIVLRQDLSGSGMGSCNLTMNLMWEQRLRPLYLKHSMADVRAFDEKGTELPLANEEAEYETSPSARRAGTELSLSFQPPPRSSQKIGRLKGRLLLAVPAEMETFQFDDASRVKGKQLRRGGLTVKLQSFLKDDFRWHARFLLTFDEAAAGALESFRAGSWLVQNELYLVDKKGNRIDFEKYKGGVSFGGVAEGVADITYIFIDVPGDIADYTLFYRSPGTILELPVEYELADLPLP